MKSTCKRIGLPMLYVYMYNAPVMNAYSYNETSPFVCISKKKKKKLDDRKLMCLMAHECGRRLYRQITLCH